MKRILINLITVALCIVSFAYANATDIALVTTSKISAFDIALDGFNETLRNGGYNVNLTTYNMAQNDLVAQLMSKKCDLVLAMGTDAAIKIKDKITRSPIVFSMILNPVQSKITETMGPSGSNITGASLDIPARIQLDLIKKVLPQAVNVGVIYSSKTADLIQEAKIAEKQMGLSLISFKVESDTEVPQAFKKLVGRVDVIWLVPDTTVCTQDSLPYMLNTSIESKLPIMGFAPYLCKAGALMSYTYDYKDIGRQTGELAIKILSGESVGDLPVEIPRKVNYVFNLKTANYLGLQIPSQMIKDAVEVFQ